MSQTFAQLINGKSATVEFSTGSASTPSVAFSGDTNTGIYSPGADQVAISTGGSGRLFVDSSGNVGLGGAPKGWGGGAIGALFNGSGSITAFSDEVSYGNNVYFNGAWRYARNDTAQLLQLGSGDIPLIFYSAATGTADASISWSERFRVDASGRFGIGSSTPSALLSVYQSTAGEVANFGTSDPTRLLRIVTGTANGIGGALITLKTDSAQGEIAFGTGGGTERARIDSSGRLLVGTSTSIGDNDLAQVHKAGGATFGLGRFTNDVNGVDLNIYKSRGATVGANGAVSNGDRLGGIYWWGNNGSGFNIGASVAAEIDGAVSGGGAGDMPSRLVFSVTSDGASSPTERMRIKSNGHLQVTTDGGFGGLDGVSHGFRTTTANWVAQFMNDQITGTNNYGVQIKYVSSAPNGTGNSFLLCGDSAADRVQLRSNGGLANFQANNVNLSDRNTKKDITPAVGTWDCIKEWEIVNYRYKDQPDDADLNLGVIAQQVAESCPEVITVFEEAKDDQPEKLGVKEQQMYWMAIKALQEAQVRIEQLEAKVAALESA